jgi:hypothetical protein
MPNWTNNVDSAIIPEGLTLMAWEYSHFRGRIWGPYAGPQKIKRVDGMNDWDSVKIFKAEAVPLFIRVYQYPDFDTRSKYGALFVGRYPNLNDTNDTRIMVGSNDIDSVDIPRGLTVVAYSHPNFQGTTYGPFRGPARLRQVPGMNDWDSVVVERS